jgi:type VII secretion system ESX-1 substrate
MTQGGSIDWLNPLPGNVHALSGEVDRLESVRDECYEIARAARGLDFDAWSGPAYSAFDDFRRTRLATQWEEVGDAHDRAATTIAEHRDTLSTLQPLARHAAERTQYDRTYSQADATADILRWRGQVASVAKKTASVLDEVAEQLSALRAPLRDEPVIVPSPPPPALVRPVVVRQTFGRHRSPAELHAEVVSLCDALLDAEFVSESDL